MKLYKLIGVFACAIFFSFPGMLMADSTDVTLKINEAYVEATPEQGQAYISDVGRTMIPLRLVSESLGYTTQWQKDGSINISSEDKTIDVTLQVGSLAYSTNNETGQFSTAPTLKDDRTYLPARDFSELYGSIYWEGLSRTVWIYQDTKVSYSVLGNELLRANAEEIVPLVMPEGYEVSSLGKPDQVLAHRTINGEDNVAINYNMNHSLRCPLFRDEGTSMSFLTTISGSSSFWVEDNVVYHTDGTSAGPWTNSINPNNLYVTTLSETGEQTKTYELDFAINECTLTMENGTLIATDLDGNRHEVDVAVLTQSK